MTAVRHGQVIGLRADREAVYRTLHSAVWPSVCRTIRDCNIRNYSIFLRDGLLFAYFEYVGDDYAADMARMAADPVTQEWWRQTAPCQLRLPSAAPHEQWVEAEELFHLD